MSLNFTSNMVASRSFSLWQVIELTSDYIEVMTMSRLFCFIFFNRQIQKVCIYLNASHIHFTAEWHSLTINLNTGHVENWPLWTDIGNHRAFVSLGRWRFEAGEA